MQVFEAFVNKKWQTVMLHCECRQSTRTTTMWPRPKLFSQGQG